LQGRLLVNTYFAEMSGNKIATYDNIFVVFVGDNKTLPT